MSLLTDCPVELEGQGLLCYKIPDNLRPERYHEKHSDTYLKNYLFVINRAVAGTDETYARVYSTLFKKYAAVHINGAGYYISGMSINNVAIKFRIHIIIMYLLSPVRSSGPTISVDHIDCNPLNNHISNLRYATKSEQRRNQTPRALTLERKPYTLDMLEFGDKLKKFEYYTDKDGIKVTFNNPVYLSENGLFVVDNNMKYLISSIVLGGYPIINIDRKHWMLHRAQYLAHNPDTPAPEIVEHIYDNKLTWDIDYLKAGTYSSNIKSAHENGSYIGTKTERTSIVLLHEECGGQWFESCKAAGRYILEIDPKYYGGIDSLSSLISCAAKKGWRVSIFTARFATDVENINKMASD